MVILAIGQLSSKLLVYVMLKFYTSMLGTAGYGEMSVIVNACDLLISVVTLSISSGVMRFALDEKNDGPMVFSIGVNVILLGSVVFLALTPLVGLIPFLKGYEWAIFIYVAIGALKEVCGVYVRSRHSVAMYAIDGIVTTVSTVVFNLILLGIFKFGITGYIFSIILGNITSMIFLGITNKLYAEYQPFGNSRTLYASMLRYSIPLMPSQIMWWIINVSDTFMVTEIIGADAAGIYSFAYRFPNLANLAMAIFSQAWRMTAITERNSRATSNFYSNAFSMMQTILFIACGGIMLILRPVIMPFFASKGFETAYMYVPILLGAVIFQSMDNFLASIYEAAQKTTHSLTSSVIGAVANIILNIVLIPAFDIMGAAIATIISYFIVFVYRIIDTKKYLYMTVYWLKLILNSALLTIMAWSIMTLEFGVAQNVINAVVFLIIAAINFKSCIQAVRLVLNKKLNKEKRS